MPFHQSSCNVIFSREFNKLYLLLVDIGGTHPDGVVQVFNSSGLQVYKAAITGSRQVINTASYKPGIYFVQVNSNGSNKTTKVIVSR